MQIQDNFDVNSNSTMQLCRFLNVELLPVNLCSELRKIYDYEIAHGNIVSEVSVYCWSSIDLQIAFAKPLFSRNIHFLNVEYYENHDAHYPIDAEFIMGRQCISGPLNESESKSGNGNETQNHYITVYYTAEKPGVGSIRS